MPLFLAVMAAHTLQLVRTKLISIPLTYIFQNVFLYDCLSNMLSREGQHQSFYVIYRIDSIMRPVCLLNIWTMRVGAFSEMGSY